MPDGGHVLIRTANTGALGLRAARGEEDPGALPSDEWVTLTVTDTGAGMQPEVLARAFDPFFTTKPLGQGTGLGLSMTHGFVQQSGGQVYLSSQPGQGTTVTIYLPRYLGAMDDATHVERGANSSRVKGLLMTQGVHDFEPTRRDWQKRLVAVAHCERGRMARL